MKQLTLFKNTKPKAHGGTLNPSKRKQQRPLATQKPIHLVLKCHKEMSLFKEFETVKYYINRYTWKFHIQVYHLSIQQDHIHLLIKIEDRNSYNKFIKSLTGMLARLYGKGLWKLSPFTRVVSWGRDYKSVKRYVDLNEDEIWGVKPYQVRHQK